VKIKTNNLHILTL